MVLHLCVIFLLILGLILFPSNSIAQGPPSPGYYPSAHFNPLPFSRAFSNLWGPQHQRIDRTGTYTIWLDKSSGSGFKSHEPYKSGYFGASIKLQPGYTAGVITSLYLSNNEADRGNHDEIDVEFLGTIPGKPYTLQTNIYVRGSGDGKNIIGREMRFHLWFDPTQDFHDYAILWSPIEIIFLVDDVPIRRYPRQRNETFPMRPMWVYGSIWDASSWATEGGKYKADYQYQPFVGRYRNFRVSGCTADAPGSCRAPSASPSNFGSLTRQQYESMVWAQKNHMVYDYCSDPKRDHALTPEC